MTWSPDLIDLTRPMTRETIVELAGKLVAEPSPYNEVELSLPAQLGHRQRLALPVEAERPLRHASRRADPHRPELGTASTASTSTG